LRGGPPLIAVASVDAQAREHGRLSDAGGPVDVGNPARDAEIARVGKVAHVVRQRATEASTAERRSDEQILDLQVAAQLDGERPPGCLVAITDLHLRYVQSAPKVIVDSTGAQDGPCVMRRLRALRTNSFDAPRLKQPVLEVAVQQMARAGVAPRRAPGVRELQKSVAIVVSDDRDGVRSVRLVQTRIIDVQRMPAVRLIRTSGTSP
jgi:hypothetical protein